MKAANIPTVARFAVVVNPGTLFEKIDVYASSFMDAVKWSRDLDEPSDVMRVLPSGELTTEF